MTACGRCSRAELRQLQVGFGALHGVRAPCFRLIWAGIEALACVFRVSARCRSIDVSSSGSDSDCLSRECRMLAKFEFDGNQHRGVSLSPHYAKQRSGSIRIGTSKQPSSARIVCDSEHAELLGAFLV